MNKGDEFMADLTLKETLANIYFNNKLFSRAAKLYEEILAKKPNSPELINVLSVAYQKLIKETTQQHKLEV